MSNFIIDIKNKDVEVCVEAEDVNLAYYTDDLVKIITESVRSITEKEQ